ncbi:MAG: glycoside hydrolase, partial [Lacunisphaera sp.]
VIGVDPDGDGKGEPVLTHRMPNVGRTYPAAEPQTSDEFDAPALGMQWQWNANPLPEWASLTKRPGFLRLASVPAPKTRLDLSPAPHSIYDAPNFLLQKFPAPEFTVTTKIEFAPQTDGEIAGLTVYGYNYALLGLRRYAFRPQLVLIVNDGADKLGAEERTVATAPLPAGAAYLRVTVTKRNTDAMGQFSFSSDNQTFTPIGEPFKASVDRWIGAKVGLIATAPSSATKTAAADFDWFRVTPVIQ